MNLKSIFLLFFSVLVLCVSAQNNTINLSGIWQVNFDTDSIFSLSDTEIEVANQTIQLPGIYTVSKLENYSSKSGVNVTSGQQNFRKVIFSKEIEIPKNWWNKSVEVFLERVLGQSCLFIDGQEYTIQNKAGIPHIYKLGKLAAGKHKLSILVECEAFSDHSTKVLSDEDFVGSYLNGILGTMEMRGKDQVLFQQVKMAPDFNNASLQITADIYSEESTFVKIDYEIVSVSNNETVLTGSVSDNIRRGKTTFNWPVKTNGKLKKWSEHTPELYTIRFKLSSGDKTDYLEKEFGYCQFSRRGDQMFANEIPVMLKGDFEVLQAQIDTSVSCNLEDWINILKAYKEKGLNYVDFQSFYPPEAAFKAASRLGIYLQIAPASKTAADEDKYNSTPVGWKYIVDNYRNYPSFAFFLLD